MKVKAVKISTEKEQKRAEKKEKTKVYLFGAAFTAIVFILLCLAQRIISDTGERVYCYIAKDTVTQGVYITDKNFLEYFTIDNRYLNEVPTNYIREPSDVYDSYTTREYVKNDVASIEGFKTTKSLMSDIAEPLEVSVSASGLPQAVGGILRAGDKINILSVESVNYNGQIVETVTYICRGAYISKAFNSGGVEVDRNSADAALIMNIVIPAEAEEEFTKAVMKGTIRMSKILNGEEETEETGESKEETAESVIEETTESVIETTENVVETKGREEETTKSIKETEKKKEETAERVIETTGGVKETKDSEEGITEKAVDTDDKEEEIE